MPLFVVAHNFYIFFTSGGFTPGMGGFPGMMGRGGFRGRYDCMLTHAEKARQMQTPKAATAFWVGLEPRVVLQCMSSNVGVGAENVML